MAGIKGAGAKGKIKKATLQKQWDAVLTEGLAMLQLNPWDTSTLLSMGTACENLEYDEAQLVYLKMAMDANLKDPDVNRQCALALAHQGRFDEAIVCWTRVLQAKPGDEEANRAIGDLTVEKTIHRGGYEGADRLLPLTFIVVVGTVTVYALTAGPLARILGLVRANPQGTLIIGAHGWAREMAAVLNAAGFETVLVDTNGSNVRAAQLEGLTAVHGSILADETIDQLPLSRLGRLMALTSNSELNALAGLALREYFGSEHLHMLATKADGLSDVRKQMLQKHCLFHNEKGFRYLEDMFEDGGILKLIPITNRFTFSDFQVQYGSDAVPMFVIDEDELHVIGGETAVSPTTGQKLISLVKLKPEPVLVPVP